LNHKDIPYAALPSVDSNNIFQQNKAQILKRKIIDTTGCLLYKGDRSVSIMKETAKLKERIIEESLKLFSVKGYTNTSTTDIIEAAGTSKGGFYNHFKSKEQLFREMLSTARKIWRERNLYKIDDEPRPLLKIQKLLENYRDRYLADSKNFPGGCIFVNLAVELSDQAPDLAKEVNTGFIRLGKKIKRFLDDEKKSGGISKSVDTESASNMIFSGLLGACVLYTSDKSKKRLNSTINSLIAYLHGIDSKG
jgi:TetR/AcrR family transcriptional repressor of nem operon